MLSVFTLNYNSKHYLGPTGLSISALKIGFILHKIQTNYIYHYTLIILVGITILFSLREMFLFFEFFIDYRLFFSVGKIYCKVFHTKYIDWYYIFIPFVESLLRKCLVKFKY